MCFEQVHIVLTRFLQLAVLQLCCWYFILYLLFHLEPSNFENGGAKLNSWWLLLLIFLLVGDFFLHVCGQYPLWIIWYASFFQNSRWVPWKEPKYFIEANAFISVIAKINEKSQIGERVVFQVHYKENPSLVPQSCLLALCWSTESWYSKWFPTTLLYLKTTGWLFLSYLMLSLWLVLALRLPYVLIRIIM